MTSQDPERPVPSEAVKWYDLFSRGARDWLRHNEKVRESAKQSLPELVAQGDVLTNPENRVVQVPVRFLEHYRFRLRADAASEGVGQGSGVEPGDVLRPGQDRARGSGGGGSGEGGVEFVLEFKVDDILDWLWEELKLPNLKPKLGGASEETEYVREGWSKRGARSRLDRRRTLKESVKRRGAQKEGPPFSDEDLRYRQLATRRRPVTHAVVVFVLDVSSSMDEGARTLAKTFFFWALQGLRRQYTRIETVFIGHTINAWEFSEEEFFTVRGSGGTYASAGLDLAAQVLRERFDPARYNAYLFYASDGENFAEDREAADKSLRELASMLNFIGYVETGADHPAALDTEMNRLFELLSRRSKDTGRYAVGTQQDVWNAIRGFFTRQVEEETA
jgi:uncharacterized sporulation protein YeaH/YhbH (DUF444 family)